MNVQRSMTNTYYSVTIAQKTIADTQSHAEKTWSCVERTPKLFSQFFRIFRFFYYFASLIDQLYNTYKTTTIADDLLHIINLITSLFTKLGNEVVIY